MTRVLGFPMTFSQIKCLKMQTMIGDMLLVTLIFLTYSSFGIENGITLPAQWAGGSPVVRLSSGERGIPISECSGVVFNSKIVLTAAHCTEEFNGIRKIKIDHLESRNSHISTFKVLRMPGYSMGFHDTPEFRNNGFDLAIIVLKWEIPFALRVFELSSTPPDLNTRVPQLWMVANGSQKPFYDSSSVALPIEDLIRYEFVKGSIFYQYKSSLANAGPCQGDSGGGVFYWNQNHWDLVGIQSTKRAVYSCESSENRGFFVAVQPNRNWILSVAESIK